MLYVWYPKNRTDLNVIHEENNAIEMEELANVKKQLKQGKHTCLVMRMEHPRAYAGINFIHNHPPPCTPGDLHQNFAPTLGLLHPSFCPGGGHLLG